MGMVSYTHHALGDDLPPVIFFTVAPLLSIVTWPEAAKAAPKKATKKSKKA